MKLNIIIIIISQSIFASGSHLLPERCELNPTFLPEVPKFLNPVDTQVLSSCSRTLKLWSHELFLKKVNTGHLDRDSSRKLVYSPALRTLIDERFSTLSIYPLSLYFHQDDVPSLKKLDVFSFISRVQTVVIEGAERLVIEAQLSESGTASQWGRNWGGMYDPNFWAWNQLIPVMDVLESVRVTAVKSLELHEYCSFVVIELSWSVTNGNMNWTATKTPRLLAVTRNGISGKQILLNHKLRNIQTLTLTEFDRSVLIDSVFAHLPKLESLNLGNTKVENISFLENLTSLKQLFLFGTEVENISALTNLMKLEKLSLHGTKVDNIAALAKLTKLEVVNLNGTKVQNIFALKNLTNL
jgi:hypothetical protein